MKRHIISILTVVVFSFVILSTGAAEPVKIVSMPDFLNVDIGDVRKEYIERVEKFFTEMKTPINRTVEHEPDYKSNSRQYGVLGNLCAVYGAFILLLVLVPNVFADRMLFVYSVGFMFIVGVILKKLPAESLIKMQLKFKGVLL